MGHTSNIEWTDSTWNCIRGCTPASPGCKNCYAANTARRFSEPGGAYEGLVRINAAGERTNDWSGKIKWVEEHLLDPLKWVPVTTHIANGDPIHRKRKGACGCPTRPRRIFVNSVSDVGHEGVTDEQLDQMFAVMALAPEHIFQILTKRPQRLLDYLHKGEMARIREAKIGFEANRINQARTGEPCMEWTGIPLPNVLLGCSVENQEWADRRWEPMYLLSKLGWKTMVSYEPALGPVDWWEGEWNFLTWLISGGESQDGSRPSHADWHRQARDFCARAGVAYFFKQWGDWHYIGKPTASPASLNTPAWHHWPDGTTSHRIGKENAGSVLDGRQYKTFPEGF